MSGEDRQKAFAKDTVCQYGHIYGYHKNGVCWCCHCEEFTKASDGASEPEIDSQPRQFVPKYERCPKCGAHFANGSKIGSGDEESRAVNLEYYCDGYFGYLKCMCWRCKFAWYQESLDAKEPSK